MFTVALALASASAAGLVDVAVRTMVVGMSTGLPPGVPPDGPPPLGLPSLSVYLFGDGM